MCELSFSEINVKRHSFITDGDGDTLNLSMVHYSFDNEEHSVLPRPHGNSKSQSAYVRTMPSTMCKLRDASQYLPPKHAVGEVTRGVGGLAGASSVSELPRNRQQSADCRRALFAPKCTRVSSNADPLFPVMLMCKESEGANSNPSTRFVRIVCNTPEPMAVLTFDWTLEDLQRFCTRPHQHVILSVDPTFNLGSFHVTVTTYRHPMLEYRHHRRRQHPVMFGPMFVHQRKTFATYNFFFSQLVGLKPNLRDIQCFGTDGEKALEDALHTQFRVAMHLRCFLHFRGNLESKLADLGISKSGAQEFLKDVFGNPVLLEEGLVDADSAELDEEFESLKKTWDDRECSLVNTTQAHFHDWFRSNSLEVIRKCMLKEKREAAGLGSPPEPFYTNDVESKNRVLKDQTCYKTQQLPAFVQMMKDMYEEQKQEIDKAVIGLGEYQLCPPYKSYEVTSKEWFKKSEKQRERVLQRFAKAELTTGDSVDQDGASTSNPLSCTKIDASIQSAMWAKAQRYLADQLYSKSPGVSDFSSVSVKSESSDRPHFVKKVGNHVYRCDKECLLFKATNGMCSHSLVVALLNGQVDTFVAHYAKSKAPVNYGQLAQHGLPLGGKKPSKRKASSKRTTSAVKEILSLADGLQRSKRAKRASGGHHVSRSPSPLLSDHSPEPMSPTNDHSVVFPSNHSDYEPSESPSYGLVAVQTQPSKRAMTEPVSYSPSLVPSDHQRSNSPVFGVSAPNTMIRSVSNTANFLSPLSQPPPLVHVSPRPQSSLQASLGSSSSVGQPFRLMFYNARISRCQGCRGEIQRGCSSPHDVIFQHKEHVLFQNPNSGNWQMSRDLRNTYYHAKFQCLASKHPGFHPSEITVAQDVKNRLNQTHIHFLRQEFGLQM